MTRKKDDYKQWLLERRERKTARNRRRREKLKIKKGATHTWKAGCLITFVSSAYATRKELRYLCRMKKINTALKYHRCAQCKIFNGYLPCERVRSSMHTKCTRKSDLSCFPKVIKKIKVYSKSSSKTGF